MQKVLPGVPLNLLLRGEPEEASSNARGHPGADTVKEPLEGEEAGRGYGEDKLAERIHRSPSTLGQSRRDGCRNDGHVKQGRAFGVADQKRVCRKHHTAN